MIDLIVDELANNAQKYFAFDGQPIIEKLSGMSYNNSGITVLRVVLGTKETKLYVKQLVVSKYNRELVHERVQTEFDILKLMHEKFQTYPDLSVARPVAVFPEHLVLITEECQGTPLDRLVNRATRIWAPRAGLVEVTSICHSAGKWLALFHEFTRQPNVEFNIEGLVEYCDVRLELLTDCAGSGVDESFRNRVTRSLQEDAKNVRVEDNFVAGRHNDFLPQHIFVDDGRLAVIDLTMYDHDSIYYDLCSLWHKLESMKIDPLVSSKAVSELQNSFFEGYGKDVDVNSPIFKAIQVRRKVTKMLEIANSGNRRLHTRYLDGRLYQKHFQWLATEYNAIGSFR